ncbi:esterase/lipase family protein [Lysinimonas soli]|uniref:Esterase/lipase family protein n=1 Tax=Lysinimonas soli TaxID=1074233 RepID=A0ABW0NPK5_9MICO
MRARPELFRIGETRPTARSLAQLIGDYPNAMRFRVQSLRHWPVPDAFRRGDRRTVVILPGIYETWHYLRPVAEQVNARGHPVLVIPGLGLNRAPIGATASRVLDELVERGLHGVALVTHSKGGIVGKHLLALDDRDGVIDRLVAIATPFAGSSMARIAPTPGLRAFLPEDPVITALAAERTVNARITSIYPRFDPHIPDGCTLEGAENIELPVVGHFRILRHPALADAVVRAVER